MFDINTISMSVDIRLSMPVSLRIKILHRIDICKRHIPPLRAAGMKLIKHVAKCPQLFPWYIDHRHLSLDIE